MSGKIEKIDDFAFAFCSNLSGEIKFPDSLKSLGECAFAYDSFLYKTRSGETDIYGNIEIAEYSRVNEEWVQTSLIYKGASGGEACYEFKYDDEGNLSLGYYFEETDEYYRKKIIARVFDENGNPTGEEEILEPFVYFNAKGTQYEVFFDNTLFGGNSYINNKYIALLSTALSDAAYSEQDIKNAYRVLGFDEENIKTYNYERTIWSPSITRAFSIASKDLNREIDGYLGGYKLLIVTLRGTGDILVDGPDDLRTDLDVVPIGPVEMAMFNSAIPVHSGFFDYAMEVNTKLNEYLSEHPDVKEAIEKGKCRMLIAGNSLGSGAGTVLGAYLNNHDFITEQFLYVYGIASPKTVSEWFGANTGKYKNIWNYVVNEDLVPALPSAFNWFGNVWKYDRSSYVTAVSLDYHAPLIYYDVIRDGYPVEKLTP